MYRSIDTKFWTDPKIRRLTPHQKFLFLYLITSGHSHVSGIFYLPKVLMQHETGLVMREVTDGIDTLSLEHLVSYDTTTEVIWVRHMLRYQHHGEKIRLAVASQLESLHSCPLIKDFLEEYADIDIPYQYPIDTRAGAGVQDQEQYQYQEQDLSPLPPRGVSTKRQVKPLPTTDYTPGFAKAWESYPAGRKEKKVDTFAIWRDRSLEPRAEEIVEKLERLKRTLWLNKEPRYIPLPTTWFYQARYEDELIPLEVAAAQQARDHTNHQEYRSLQAGQRFVERHSGTERQQHLSGGNDAVIDGIEYRTH